MNFLGMAKRVRQEVGYSGVGPASVESQIGVYGKIIDWTKSAVEETHLCRTDWRFDWAQYNAALVLGQRAYNIVQGWGLDFRSLASDPLYVYRTADGDRSRYFVTQLDWASFRQIPLVEATGMPSYFAISPDGVLHFDVAPADGLTAVMAYYRLPQELTDNNSVSRIPEQYHMAVVWAAVLMAAEHDENPVLAQSAARRLKRVRARMEETELPMLSAIYPEFL